jgi:Flp pilus assembly pilin Flp
MNYLYLRLLVSLQNLVASEEGQDLVEYALLVCMVALGAIAGVNKVASSVTSVFTRVSSTLA